PLLLNRHLLSSEPFSNHLLLAVAIFVLLRRASSTISNPEIRKDKTQRQTSPRTPNQTQNRTLKSSRKSLPS
ncbi:hypothetical protein VIGAN_03024100, partial [Vigna angularis var. angularis]